MTLDAMHAQTATPDANVLMSVAEVARRAGVSRRTVYREIDRGALVAHYVGHQLRIARTTFVSTSTGRGREGPPDRQRQVGADSLADELLALQ